MAWRLLDLRVAFVVCCLVASAVVSAPIGPVSAQVAEDNGPPEFDHSVPSAPCSGPTATILGTSGNDVLVGTAGDDVIFGLAGDDQIDGRGGNDIIVGGSGADTISGGNGNDTICGGQGNDAISGNAGDDQLFGQAGDDGLIGGNGSDSLFGGLNEDTLEGGNGPDQLSGGAGDDVLTGSADSDTLYGDSGADVLSGRGGDDLLWGGNGRDRLNGGTGQDQLVGGDGNDRLFGNDDADLLFGSDGNDRLSGGPGDDELVGGSGEDIATGGDGNDVCESETPTLCESTGTDTEAPSAPVSLLATSDGIGQVFLQWGASQDNVGVADYIILRDGLEVGVSTATTFNDASVSAGDSPSYVVQARDFSGNISGRSGIQITVGGADSLCNFVAPSNGVVNAQWYDAPAEGSLVVYKWGGERFVRTQVMERDEFVAFAYDMPIALGAEIRVVQELPSAVVGAAMTCETDESSASVAELLNLPTLPDGRIGAEATSSALVDVPLAPTLPQTPQSVVAAESICATGGLYQPVPPDPGSAGKQYAMVYVPQGYTLTYDAYAIKGTTSSGNWSSRVSIHKTNEDRALLSLEELRAMGSPFYWDTPGEVLLGENVNFFTNSDASQEFAMILDFGTAVSIDPVDDAGAAHRLDDFRLVGPNGDSVPLCALDDLFRCQAAGGNFFVPDGEIVVIDGDPISGCKNYDSCVGDGSVLQWVGEWACENDELLSGLLAASVAVVVVAGVIVAAPVFATVSGTVTTAGAYGAATFGTAGIVLPAGVLTVTVVYYNQLLNPASPDVVDPSIITSQINSAAQDLWSRMNPTLDPVLDGPSVTIDPNTGVATWTGPTITTGTEEAIEQRTIKIDGQSRTIDDYVNDPDVPEPKRRRFLQAVKAATKSCVVVLLPGTAEAAAQAAAEAALAALVGGITDPAFDGETVSEDGLIEDPSGIELPRHVCEYVNYYIPGTVTTGGFDISVATIHIHESLGNLGGTFDEPSHVGLQPAAPNPFWRYLNRDGKARDSTPWYRLQLYNCFAEAPLNCDEWPWYKTTQGGDPTRDGGSLYQPHLRIIDNLQNQRSGADLSGFYSACNVSAPENESFFVEPMPIAIIQDAAGQVLPVPSIRICSGS